MNKMTMEKHPIYGKVSSLSSKFEEEEVLKSMEEIISPYNLSVEILPENIMSRGVQGDEGTYTRVAVLRGENPGYEVLRDISSTISNKLPINRVHFEILRK